ncbi:MAG: sulfotransferase domain-containing protein [Pseudomonadales bacterium]|nr:sulfotransferase domain-containing protein [Pseudomonadales bacterium]
MQQLKRAKSLAEMAALQGKLFTRDELRQGLALQLRFSDIVISPFPKSGTTWLQQMVHTLRTGGDMDFDDISRVIPWIETSAALDIDLGDEQRAKPRAFKSHLSYELIPKGGRYIHAIRDPKDVLISNFKFVEGWFLEPGTVSLDEFAQKSFIDSGGYWQHLLSWWAVSHQNNVLCLAYEQMLAAPETAIQRVAEFIDIPLDDDLLTLTREYISFEFMLKNKNRFDDAMMIALSEQRCSLPAGSDGAKVRIGQAGGHQQILSAATSEALDQVWQEKITPVLGFANYAALLAELDE